MFEDDELLRAATTSFEAAGRAMESCRTLLNLLLDRLDDVENISAPVGLPIDNFCHHPNAVDVTTMGTEFNVWLCPDCGAEFL